MSAITVYAIHFECGAIYVGLTENLDRRMKEHRRRQSPSTRRFSGDFCVLHTKDFPSYASARVEEKRLKSGPGRAFLKSLIASHQDVKRPKPCQGLSRFT